MQTDCRCRQYIGNLTEKEKFLETDLMIRNEVLASGLAPEHDFPADYRRRLERWRTSVRRLTLLKKHYKEAAAKEMQAGVQPVI